MKGFAFGISVLFLTLLASSAMAANSSKGGDIPITQEILDVDTITGAPYYIQSDGLGMYLNTITTYKGKTTGTNSVLTANVCGSLPNGDRLLETSFDTRKVKITFDPTNAVQPGDPN
jgi:hypothetical protein